jgi:LuxR family maltose regulon positive regulatory protein
LRIFLDEGDHLEALLLEAHTEDDVTQRNYIGNLLRAFQAAAYEKEPKPVYSTDGLVEPLSERELEVLGYLDTHLTSNEIADVLCIAVSTVRSHIKSIYSKLNAHNRNEAVIRAQELDIL